MTFVIRLTVREDGRLTGVVTRVRTGDKERFDGAESLPPIITRMAREEAVAPGAAMATPPARGGQE
jgi:hypothetical protein